MEIMLKTSTMFKNIFVERNESK